MKAFTLHNPTSLDEALAPMRLAVELAPEREDYRNNLETLLRERALDGAANQAR